MRKRHLWSWFWVALGLLYFFVPLYATLDFSLRAEKDKIGLAAYVNVFSDALFYESFTFSLQAALLTVGVSCLLIVPTVYWVQLRLPRLRPVIEFVTLLPFVVPAVVLVFGLTSVPLANLGARVALATDAARLERLYGAGLALFGTTLLVLTH
jgi:putative spermidine/putrescine transport system permease protein